MPVCINCKGERCSYCPETPGVYVRQESDRVDCVCKGDDEGDCTCPPEVCITCDGTGRVKVDHQKCIEADREKVYRSCDCQHRSIGTTILHASRDSKHSARKL